MEDVAPRRRVGIIGHGAVGSVVAEVLDRGAPGIELAGVYAHSAVPDRYRAESFSQLLARSDLVVEAASQEAVRSYGPDVVQEADLLIVSVGALHDDALLSTLRGGAGRLFVTTGAIGGIDQLRAASLLGELESVSLTTYKHGAEQASVFDGYAREAVKRFPTSINVAATLSLATIGFDRVRVRLVTDPEVQHVEHHIEAHGPAGAYEFRFRNIASAQNVRTSAITPYAVLRGLGDLHAHTVIGI